MRPFIRVLNVFIVISMVSLAYAQTTLDPKKYDENGFVRDQKSVVTTVAGREPRNTPSTSQPNRATQKPPQPVINVASFKLGEPASCFDYYTFGSIAVNLSTDTSSYAPGDPVILTGQITNNNRYPITHLTIKARMVRDIPNPEYFRSEIITLEDIDIVKDITLKAGESFDIRSTHLLPLNAPKGNYQIFFYAYNNDRFNQAGLSFTNDIVASRLNFTVTGNNPQYIYLDQTKITLNDQPYNVMAFMTNHNKDTPITISVPLVNPSQTAEDMTVTYTLYKWDGLREENIVDTKREVITVPAKGKKILTYTTAKTDTSVYFLTITATATNQIKDTSVHTIQTQSNIRFSVSGYDFPRVNSFGVDTYPIKADTEATLFTCYHNGANQDTQNVMNIKTTLYDDKNTIIAQTEYEGTIAGDINAIIKKFTLRKDLVNFKTITTITDNTGAVIDIIEQDYTCQDMDPTLCPKPTIIPGVSSTTEIPWIYILLGLVVLLILLIIIKRHKHGNQSNMISTIFLTLTILFIAWTSVGKVEAAIVTAPFEMVFDWSNDYGNTLLDTGEPVYPDLLTSESSWATTYQEAQHRNSNSMFVGEADGTLGGTFHKVFNFKKAGVNLSDTGINIINIGERINAFPHGTTGDWFAVGRVNDSPPMDGIVYFGRSAMTTDIQVSGVKNGGTFSSSVSIPRETGDVRILSSNTNIVSCDTGGCDAVGPGTAEITVSFTKVVQNSPYDYTCNIVKGTKYSTSPLFTYAGKCVSGKKNNAGNETLNIIEKYYNNGFWKYDDTGYGFVNIAIEGSIDTEAYHTDTKSFSFSFPPITYTITVPPAPNQNHASACSGITNISTSGAAINWTYSDADNDPQTNYQIQIATDSSFASIVQSIVPPANTNVSNIRSVAVTGLLSNTTYYARVRTYNNANSWSGYSTCSGGFTTLVPPITANCSASPTSASPGQSITWTANNVLGGTGVYSFLWSGDDTLSGTTNPLSKTYTTAGTKNASVLITSGNQTKTVTCTVATVAAPVDMCTNIEDIQTTVPAGLTRTAVGNCVCGS